MAARKRKEMPRREEFLHAALTRFAKLGYSATSTRDICAEVGLVHSAIYNYFPSKEAVVLAIEEREMTALISALRETLDETGESPRDRLLVTIVQLFDNAILRQKAWRLMADMIRSLKPRNRQLVIKRRDEYQGMVRDVLAAAAAAGLITPRDARLSTLHLFGLAEGLAGWFRKDGELGRVDTIADIATFALRGMGADERLCRLVADFLPVEEEQGRSKAAVRAASRKVGDPVGTAT